MKAITVRKGEKEKALLETQLCVASASVRCMDADTLPPSRLADCWWEPLGRTLVPAAPVIQASEREPSRLSQSGFYVFSFDFEMFILMVLKNVE